MSSTHSPSWKAILSVTEHYLAGMKVNMGFGDICRLWMDPVGENVSFCVMF
jgi:hypothetical protein